MACPTCAAQICEFRPLTQPMPSLEPMMFSWGDSRTAFADAAGWFVHTAALTGGLAGPLLLAATGRPGLPAGFSVL